MLEEQAGLFLPEVNSVQAFNECFLNGSRTKIKQKYADDFHETWDDCRIVIVANDLACNYVKVFEVSQHDFFARNARRLLNVGESPRIQENDQYLIENAKNEGREDGSVGCGMEEYENVSLWLGLSSEQFCAVNGISATYMRTEMLTSNINDLLLANASFFDFVLEFGEVDEARMIEALEQPKKPEKNRARGLNVTIGNFGQRLGNLLIG